MAKKKISIPKDKILRYRIVDSRDDFGEWSVVDLKKKTNIYDWRSGIIFSGKKSDCKKHLVSKGIKNYNSD